MTKKDLERRYLDRFKECLPDFPEGRIVDEEPPDFLVHAADYILGIELTHVYHPAAGDGTRMQAHESTEDKQARELYDRSGGPPLIVYINFAGPLRLKKDSAAALADRLASLVRNSIPAKGDTVEIQNRWEDDAVPDEVDSVVVMQPPEITRPLWATTRAGWEWNPGPSDIQPVIDEKNRRAISSRQKCPRVWLVIIASGNVPSQFIEPSAAAISHIYSAAFDRVFFLESANHRVFELQISPP